MASTLDRLTYAARQTARVAWYAGHYAAGRRLLKPMPKPDFPVGPTPSRGEMTADIRALFAREWQDIEAGLFPVPRAIDAEPGEFSAGRSTEASIIRQGYGDVDALLRSASIVVELELAIGRHSGVPLEATHFGMGSAATASPTCAIASRSPA